MNRIRLVYQLAASYFRQIGEWNRSLIAKPYLTLDEIEEIENREHHAMLRSAKQR